MELAKDALRNSTYSCTVLQIPPLGEDGKKDRLRQIRALFWLPPLPSRPRSDSLLGFSRHDDVDDVEIGFDCLVRLSATLRLKGLRTKLSLLRGIHGRARSCPNRDSSGLAAAEVSHVVV